MGWRQTQLDFRDCPGGLREMRIITGTLLTFHHLEPELVPAERAHFMVGLFVLYSVRKVCLKPADGGS